MKRSPRFLLVALVITATVSVWGVGPVWAQANPSAPNCSAVLITPGIPDVSMFLIPNGGGSSFVNCFQRGGTQVPSQILVTLIDAFGSVVVGYPPNRIRIEEIGSPLIWCANASTPVPPHWPNLADSPTNNAGQTTFTNAYFGGSWVDATATGGTFVWVADNTGTWFQIPTPLMVSYNSPDINGDLVVNLSDVATFAGDFFTGYNYRSDFNYDQVINLTDVAMFASAMGAVCP